MVAAVLAVTVTGMGTIYAAQAALAQDLAARAQDDGATTAGRVVVLGQEVDAATLGLGHDLYATNCASCHGASLEGQPDWKRRLETGRMPAPPHDATGHTWHHSDQDLFTIVQGGLGAVVPGYESDMPAFGSTLSDEEITAVLAWIKSTWPERESAFQAEITRADLGEDG